MWQLINLLALLERANGDPSIISLPFNKDTFVDFMPLQVISPFVGLLIDLTHTIGGGTLSGTIPRRGASLTPMAAIQPKFPDKVLSTFKVTA